MVDPEIDLMYDRMVDHLRDHMAELPELWDAFVKLDDHLRKGGQLPSPWSAAQRSLK